MDDEKSKILFSHVKYSYVLTNCMGNRFRFFQKVHIHWEIIKPPLYDFRPDGIFKIFAPRCQNIDFNANLRNSCKVYFIIPTPHFYDFPKSSYLLLFDPSTVRKIRVLFIERRILVWKFS